MSNKLALAIILAAQGVLPAPVRAEAAANVTASHPSKVFVNGREAGRTPLYVGSLPQGTHEIRVVNLATDELKTFQLVAPARVFAERTFHATFDEAPVACTPAAETFVVTPQPGPAVTVQSNTLATVYLDNVRLGQTPLTMMAVLPGFHVLKLVDAYSGVVLTKPFKMQAGPGPDLNWIMEFPQPVVRLLEPITVRPSIIYVTPSHRSHHGARSHHGSSHYSGYRSHPYPRPYRY